jgi:hypothetical protein
VSVRAAHVDLGVLVLLETITREELGHFDARAHPTASRDAAEVTRLGVG